MAARKGACSSLVQNQTIEDCCPDLLYAKLLSSLKSVFKHDDFKSKLQECAVKKVAASKLKKMNRLLSYPKALKNLYACKICVRNANYLVMYNNVYMDRLFVMSSPA